MTDLRVITCQTDRNVALDNWIYSAKNNEYNYIILGLDETWKGWSWRTNKYLNYVKTLPPTTIVCLTDCNDILFLKHESEMIKSWNYYNKQGFDLVFGGEATCCTGDYRAHINPIGRINIMNTVKSFGNKYTGNHENQNRWMFPNAGFIIGTTHRIIEALTLAQDAKDDQAKYLEKYSQNENWLTIDYDHKLVGNLNALAILYKQLPIPGDYYNDELKYWDLINCEEEDNCLGNIQLKNKITRGQPCVAHFPGKNYPLYNYIGKKLYGEKFTILEFTDKMTTLWTIKFW